MQACYLRGKVKIELSLYWPVLLVLQKVDAPRISRQWDMNVI
jgi:hypothetical protein